MMNIPVPKILLTAAAILVSSLMVLAGMCHAAVIYVGPNGEIYIGDHLPTELRERGYLPKGEKGGEERKTPDEDNPGINAGKEPDAIILRFPLSINYYISSNRMFLMIGEPVSRGEGWEIKKTESGRYSFKYRTWSDYFWEVDADHKTLSVVSQNKPFLVKDVSFWGKAEKSDMLDFKVQAKLRYDTRTGKFSVTALDKDIPTAGWEIKKITPTMYHLRNVLWGGDFWEIDTKRLIASSNFSYTKNFGTPVSVPGSVMEAINVELEGSGAAAPAGEKVLPDQGFRSDRPYRPSDWTRSEMNLYASVLYKGSFDVLIAPFQVQGYAVSRANRGLMTRYLSDSIERFTGLKVPDPTIVAKTLGEGARRLSDDDIYRAAQILGVKYVIRGYSGHNLDEKLFLTLLVQARDKDGNLNDRTPITRLDLKDIPFSDEYPPAEAFKGVLNDIVNRLTLPVSKKPKTAVYAREKTVAVPKAVAELTKKQSSPVLDAYYLQLLGELYPADTDYDDAPERESLFERSLVALNAVSPESPDCALLKARAYFYLNSRPAALEALGKPKTPEEKAMLALLNGNRTEMEKWVGKIDSPLHRLMAEIELSDLRSDYGVNKYKEADIKGVAAAYPGWELLIVRRLVGRNIWAQLPNVFTKKMLDDAFPVNGFTVENLVRGKIASDEDPESTEMDLSIYRHRRRVMEEQAEKFIRVNGSNHPVEMDHLDLLYLMGETNIWKKVRLRLFTQGLYKEAKELIEGYEVVYRENLKLDNLKMAALQRLEVRQTGNYEREISKLRDDLCYRAQAQTATNRCVNGVNYYLADYPRHMSMPWAQDRKVLKKHSVVIDGNPQLASRKLYFDSLELNLLYTTSDFRLLKKYYQELNDNNMPKEAQALLELNKDRFIGDPKQAIFMAEIAQKSGDDQRAAGIYEKAIASNPDVWEFRDKLGMFYLKNGEYKKAFSVYSSYAPFSTGEGDSVATSNQAYNAGGEFFWRGLPDEAAHFFKISAEGGTGAGSEMWSAAYLSIMNNDYGEAATNFLRDYKRYDTPRAHADYITMLNLTGNHKEAWAVFDSADIRKNNWLLDAAVIGFRMEGKSEEEQRKRLLTDGYYKPFTQDAEYFVIQSHLMDRAPDPDVAKHIWDLGRVRPYGEQRPYSEDYYIFARGYYSLRTKKYDEAFHHLKSLEVTFFDLKTESGYGRYIYALPYFAWSSAKTGHVSEAEGYLESGKGRYGEDFIYNLSRALIHGAQGRHQEAVSRLKSAKNHIVGPIKLPFPKWYMLVEACEWLYEDTGYEQYRELALEWAKVHQKILPMEAWAFAVEAKYTKSAPERLRALALTLYLDKRSERISGFSGKEREDALKWLEKNNPFLKKPRPQGGA